MLLNVQFLQIFWTVFRLLLLIHLWCFIIILWSLTASPFIVRKKLKREGRKQVIQVWNKYDLTFWLNYPFKSNMHTICNRVMSLCYISWSVELVSIAQSLRCGRKRFWSRWLCVRGHHLSCPATLLLVFPLLKPSGWTAVSVSHHFLLLIVSHILTLPLLSITLSFSLHLHALFELFLKPPFHFPLLSLSLSLSHSLILSVCVLCTAVSVTALVLS